MPNVLGKYEITGELGKGAMGVVYEGFDTLNSRPVAIKTINKSLFDPADKAGIFVRFRPDAQAAFRLVHPGIVSIYEYGEVGDVLYIVMERLTGISVDKFLNNGRRLDVTEISNIIYQLLDALEYSHKRGVVHCHIKPENIVLVKDGNIKITDFGLSKIQALTATKTGKVTHPSSYMSPEQYLGRAADARGDVYSTGVILYQLLTGQLPYTRSGSNPEGEFITTGIAKPIADVIKTALENRPEDRYQSVDELRDAIIEATPIPSDYSFEKKIANPPPQREIEYVASVAALSVDMPYFEERLRESKQEADGNRTLKTKQGKDHIEEPVIKLTMPGDNDAEVKNGSEINSPVSTFLDSLAQEAQATLSSKKSRDITKLEQDSHLHEALVRVSKFLVPFAKHVNNLEPTINRIYSLGAKSEFTNLKWSKALVDSRKLSLSENAHLAFVTFRLKLHSTEPVVIKRPANQFEALKKELQNLRLRTLEDLDVIQKSPKQEWLEVQLESMVPVQITFKGNYDLGKVKVLTRNLADFGLSSFTLDPDEVTPALMDDLGRYLIGRSDKLPALLLASGSPSKTKVK